MAGVGAQRLEHREARHPRHVQVKQQDVDRVTSAEALQHFGAISHDGQLEGVSARLERTPGQDHLIIVVVSQEDAKRHPGIVRFPPFRGQ